ncbi:MAG: hypothetical protein F4Y82_00620 [Cenarchaeum sp. SB0665_bin_23]|nr:hypothetical protein [Cenarchaeum sp. SB0667_bin_13]MXY37731.1 hypothetical protein [Cenarchaeum sp. SB0664_bin_35]MXY60608.1 hypothetical protein [Cenarchaeum sp. SB0665_bin_23]MXZ92940.1 hypothetical protein [Cenarchaeum sp. SB0666_bin_15]MYB47493.1 hypothetical protein [Cenarchaeum sp. SB0662_bin_33]MYC79787.1 hypothetical protein [Cenarchaeum sp. SB0661_bin_35]MYD58340.1 hypothetical protein [Cenarchaeum sp. SB0678_bin_8]MYG32984.1 hypothetical protein [Cenarchaeum sp. SB0677_bin_16]
MPLLFVVLLMQSQAQATDTILGEPTLVDANGMPISGHINVNQKFYIEATLTHQGNAEQQFVYIVQIADERGSTILLKWLGGEVGPGQMLNIAVSWTPAASGTYTIDTFLWDGIHAQNALDANKSVMVSIS